MPECPVCRRAFDGRFAVFVPPRDEAFDTLDCARRAAELGDDQLGTDGGRATPLVLPTIDVLTSLGGSTRAARARSQLGAGLRRRAPVPAVVAAGLSLVAAGSASSLYLWAGLPETANQTTRTAAPVLTSPPAPSAGSNEVTAPIAPQGPRTREHPQAIAEITSARRTTPADESSKAAEPSISEPTEPQTSEVPEPLPPPPSAGPSPEPSPPPPAPAPASPPAPQPPPRQPQPPPEGRGPTVGGDTPPAVVPSAPTREPTQSHGDTDNGGSAVKPKKPKKPNPNPHPTPPVPPAPPEHAEGNGYGADGNQAGGQGNGGERGDGNGNGNGNGQAKGKDK